MFFIVASLIALLTLVYLVASGFVRVVSYFWGWLSSGEKIDGVASNASGDATANVSSTDISGGVLDDASFVSQSTLFSKSKPTQADLSAYLDEMHLGWYQIVILFFVGCMAGLLI